MSHNESRFEIQALEHMKGAIIVAFKDKENNILGFSSPYPIKVYDKPTPRLDIEAKIYDHKCGFDLEGKASRDIYSIYSS